MGGIITIKSEYNEIRVLDSIAYHSGREIRILQTDPLGAQSLMYLDNPPELYSDYTKFYDLAFHWKRRAKRALMLGGGGYCVPRHLAAARPGVGVDIVEIDPEITRTARNYFRLTDREGQKIFHEDARAFIARAAKSETPGDKYDAVFHDVFGPSYKTPYSMTTADCMADIRGSLTQGGVFIMNVISAMNDAHFRGILSAVKEAFRAVALFPATYPNSPGMRQNIMIAAAASENFPEREPENEYMARLLAHKWVNS
ncbi:hypothetical protein FACS1894216_07510 [Synergistales bacterium]|nr:hypothetical protein FACS1894216_07510 [Synergistales bacterium]